MIGTTGAGLLFVVNILFASVLGVGAGGFTCLLLRRSWSLKAVVIDAMLGALVALLAAYVISAVETARGVWESRVTLMLAVAVASVIGRHILRPAAS
jgi:hypothetical protein